MSAICGVILLVRSAPLLLNHIMERHPCLNCIIFYFLLLLFSLRFLSRSWLSIIVVTTTLYAPVLCSTAVNHWVANQSEDYYPIIIIILLTLFGFFLKNFRSEYEFELGLVFIYKMLPLICLLPKIRFAIAFNLL